MERELNLKGTLLFPGEHVENSICIGEDGIYVVTSKRMLKVVWSGTKLSIDAADGGWQCEYNTMRCRAGDRGRRADHLRRIRYQADADGLRG